MSICPYDAFQAILVELASGDVFRICDAITLFRQQLTTSTYIRFTTSKRWQTAWRVTLETVGYENLKDINDAKKIVNLQPVVELARKQCKCPSKIANLFPSVPTCKKLLNLKPFDCLSPNTQLSLFSIARSRKLSANDVDGYTKVCISIITTVLGKRLCYNQWDIEAVPDRDLTQEDVEEENYTKKIKSTPTTNYNIDDLINTLTRSKTIH
jgi:hypothetical protein